jgi:two-component system, LytTR family, sensor kinase
MKTKIPIILLFLLILFSERSFPAVNDTVWTSYHWGGYKLQILGGDLHYYTRQKIRVIPDDPNKTFKVSFDDGTLEKIDRNWYYITPNKMKNSKIMINDISYTVFIYPIQEPTIYIEGDEGTFSGVITKDILLKANRLIAKNRLSNFKVISFTLVYFTKNNYEVYVKCNDTVFTDKVKESLKKIETGADLYIEDIHLQYPDNSTRFCDPQKMRIIDNYYNEFIRKTVSFKPFTYDLNLMKNDLRIKLAGHPDKKAVQIITDFAKELNGLLETIKVKIVDDQPSLTIIFDTIKNDTTYVNAGCKSIYGGFLVKEQTRLLYPFSKSYVMLIDTNKLAESGYSILKYDIVNLLGEFKENNITGSIFHDSDSLSDYDKYTLKTMYSEGGEYKILKIMDSDFDYPDKTIVVFILLLLSVCLLFIFSEIYNYYGLNFLISKVKNKIFQRVIEAMLVAQIPVIAFLVLLTGKFTLGDFHEASTCLIIEMYLLPFSVLAGILFLGLDLLLDRVSRKWFMIILNFILSFVCLWLAYQLIYFFITPEFISLSLIDWKIKMVAFIITFYRLYSRFQTSKITGMLQEKELEIAREKELKIKSDLNALQARINPHFLYNALNSLASLAYIDAGRTEKMALSLSKLFRYNINKEDEHFSTLKEEIEMTEIYLEVEKNRFEDKLEYNIEVQNDLYDFKIPKFLLQPLVENAVKHGISKITGKGKIRVKIFEQGNKVRIEIYDNGPAFSDSLITGYGLQNTYEKLKLLYKKPFEIEFINEAEKKLVIMLNK